VPATTNEPCRATAASQSARDRNQLPLGDPGSITGLLLAVGVRPSQLGAAGLRPPDGDPAVVLRPAPPPWRRARPGGTLWPPH
jgi:hypothetical protein